MTQNEALGAVVADLLAQMTDMTHENRLLVAQMVLVAVIRAHPADRQSLALLKSITAVSALVLGVDVSKC